MPELRLNITMSLDGYVAGPDQSPQNPLGVGGGALHEWAFATRTFRRSHGMDGGETGPDDDLVAESLEGIGATIMGRRMFGGGEGPWGADPWSGWWGGDPPFHTPVFVLTHHPRAPLEMEGGTTFHFVTEGIASALRLAMEAADGRDVALGGGAEAVQQYLAAGSIDEMHLHVVPVMLGGGARLFEGTAGAQAGYRPARVVSSPGVTHVRLRRAEAAPA